MNAYQFSQAEQARESQIEAAYYAEADAAEDMCEELQAEAYGIWTEVVADANGDFRDGIVEEALGGIDKDEMRRLATLISGHQDQAAGQLVRKEVNRYWRAWCRREGEKRIAARNKRAADEYAMEKAERKFGAMSVGGRFA